MYGGDGRFWLNCTMNQKAKARPIRVAIGVCGLCLCYSAVASPPFSWGSSSPSAIPSARAASLASQSVARHDYAPAAYLDLRPPEVSPLAFSHETTAALASESFPSTTHHLDPGKSDLATGDRVQPSTLGMGEMNFRVMSQAAIYAHRVHEDGLPIVRVFESKSALLSIGLNKRGKPGLWFTQKTH